MILYSFAGFILFGPGRAGREGPRGGTWPGIGDADLGGLGWDRIDPGQGIGERNIEGLARRI